MYGTITSPPMFPLWPNRTCSSSTSQPMQGSNNIDLLNLQLEPFVDLLTVITKSERMTMKTITMSHISQSTLFKFSPRSWPTPNRFRGNRPSQIRPNRHMLRKPIGWPNSWFLKSQSKKPMLNNPSNTLSCHRPFFYFSLLKRSNLWVNISSSYFNNLLLKLHNLLFRLLDLLSRHKSNNLWFKPNQRCSNQASFHCNHS